MVQKNLLVKCGAGICMAATAALLLTGGVGVRAQVRGTSTGLAGISFFIDQYYEGNQNGAGVTATSLGAGVPVEQDEQGEADTGAKAEVDPAPLLADGAEEKEELKKRAVEEPVSEYANVGISIADNYVNIRKEPNTDSEVVGKLYKGCAATITEEAGEWVKIVSGNAEGYINAEYLAIGFDAEELVDKYGTKWAVVNTETLRVRMEPSTEAKIATLVPQGERLLVTSVDGEWVEISIDDGDITGFVSADFVEIEVDFEHAVTVEEEQAELRRQQEAEEALRRQQERQRQQQTTTQQQSGSNNNSNSSSNKNNANKSSSNKNTSSNTPDKSNSSNAGSTSSSGLGSDIAAFAKKFVGYPYVYGGTSLTNGADCSGFVQSVYKNFGISIPRDSRSQCAGAGYQVSLDSLQPGDLVFYTNNSGTVNHVAMYIGGGQIVHASDPSTGIMISNMRYRSPYMAKRVVN